MAVSLVALWGPAVAALVTSALTGSDALRHLRERCTRWRVPLHYYLLALLAPLFISALASAFEYIAAGRGPVHPMPISPLQAVVFDLVAGEEIGWRGFALPLLLTRTGPWRASAAIGGIWALWHFPLFRMATMPQFGSPFLPFVGYTIALSLILTLLARKTGGSVVIATLFHGAVNTLGFVNDAASPALRSWANAASYGLVAVVAGLVAWSYGRASGDERRASTSS
jgi:membrane protease YdiL (CAAX protease family)